MNNPAFLYVEDDYLSRDIMQLTLTEILEYEQVTIWNNSDNFAAKFQALSPKPDIIFLDIHVRPLNGFEMLAIIRETHPEVPVIALTASVMNEEVQKLRVAGFTGAIAKPLDQDTFPRLLDRIMRGDTVWQITQ